MMTSIPALAMILTKFLNSNSQQLNITLAYTCTLYTVGICIYSAYKCNIVLLLYTELCFAKDQEIHPTHNLSYIDIIMYVEVNTLELHVLQFQRKTIQMNGRVFCWLRFIQQTWQYSTASLHLSRTS